MRLNLVYIMVGSEILNKEFSYDVFLIARSDFGLHHCYTHPLLF